METDKRIFEQLTSIFRDIFQNDSLKISPETRNGDIDEWTSLNHAILIDTIEKKFNISFDFDEILTMHSVKDIYNNIAKKIN